MSIEYPIRGKRIHYSGSDSNKAQKAADFNRIASEIDNHVNNAIKNGKRGLITYRSIAAELGLDHKIIAEVLFSVDGGNTGLTIPHNLNA